MLCRRLNKILYTQSSIHHSSQYRCFVISRSKCSWRNRVFSALKTDPMSSYRLRLILRDLSVTRLWNAWFRTQLVSSMVRRCRRDRGVRDMLACFKQTILRPSRTFLLSATAAYKSNIDDRKPEPCRRSITDPELEELTKAFEGVDELSRTTLFCKGCNHRLVIDKNQPGVTYCVCPDTHPPGVSEDGWTPYMEADDVVIWRKEYKAGGLYAYKVYGRYSDLKASTFATIQVDGAYRRSWDDAVAALALVERRANGVPAQSVLHWEVAWPRFFSNRDYVYIRRHKEFNVVTKCLAHMEAIFNPDDPDPCPDERPNVHTHAKRKSMEEERRQAREAKGAEKLNKVYVIISRSCTHPSVPETRSPIRVQEYWSDMVVRSLDGVDKPGMEFVLTYYDEPAVGGLPGGVSAWATGRAVPVYLARMRRAAAAYAAWCAEHTEEPDFEPFDTDSSPKGDDKKPETPDVVVEVVTPPAQAPQSRDQSTQTEEEKKETRPEVPPRPQVTEPVPKPLLPEVKTAEKPAGKAKGDSPNVQAQPVEPTPKPLLTEVKTTEKPAGKAKGDSPNVQAQPVEPIPKPLLTEVKTAEKPAGKAKADSPNVQAQPVEPIPKSLLTEIKAAEKPAGQAKSDSSNVEAETELQVCEEVPSKDGDCGEEEAQSNQPEAERKNSWWRYLYPLYYFV